MDVKQAGTLDRMIARVVETMNPEAIYLFGSRARGDARADSDYDFLVIMSDDAPPIRVRWRQRPASPEIRACPLISFPVAAACSNANAIASAL